MISDASTHKQFDEAFHLRRNILLCCVASLTIGFVQMRSADAQTQKPPHVKITIAQHAPSQTGIVDSSWNEAAEITLPYDFVNRRGADEKTTVRLLQDSSSLDIAFDVRQNEPVLASTETNGPGVKSDDYVGVYISPAGSQGFQYGFFANPLGSRYQTSSENSLYTPQWTAVGKVNHDGYQVTMRIPLDIVRGGTSSTWAVQFVRAVVHTNSIDVWAFNERAASISDATFFGELDGLSTESRSRIPPARAQLYALAETTSGSRESDTSRVGGDLSLPITPTTSFVASIHPDFSNVEVDQETIAPSAFQHYYSDVRPFFAQAGSLFNATFNNLDAPTMLYTPAIPVFRQGYALEGTEGPLSIAAFDVIGTGRSDQAETATYGSSNPLRAYNFTVQSVGVDAEAANGNAAVHDYVTSLSTGFMNQHSHFLAYANFATEHGSGSAPTGQADYYQTGIGYSTSTTTGIIAYHHISPTFSPVDGYVSQDDVSGPEVYVSQTEPFKPHDFMHDANLVVYGANYDNSIGRPAQRTVDIQLNVDLSNLLSVKAYRNLSDVQTFNAGVLPFDSDLFAIGYKLYTATPSYVQNQTGAYYHGRLDAWAYVTTLQLTPRAHLELEADEDRYLTIFPGESSTNQWLDRASLDFQISQQAQIDFGARKVQGPNLPVSYAPVDFSSTLGTNLSCAFHYLARSGKDEIFLVYGDPSAFMTAPTFVLKYIRYFGAPKGT